jgi:hypothetical protein
VFSPASGLLYSKEFYRLAGRRLKQGGLLQQWLPEEAPSATLAAAAKAILAVFPNVRAFRSIYGSGVHFIASNEPIPDKKAKALIKRLPLAAGSDLVEWGPGKTPGEQITVFMSGEIYPDLLPRLYAGAAAISDDRPFNEYFFLREHFPNFWHAWCRRMKIT